MNVKELESKTLVDLRVVAKELGLQKISDFKKAELVQAIVKASDKLKASETVTKADKSATKKPNPVKVTDTKVTVSADVATHESNKSPNRNSNNQTSNDGRNSQSRNVPSKSKTVVSSIRNGVVVDSKTLKHNSNNHSNGSYSTINGVLDVMKDRTHGIIRTEGVLPGDDDVYISGTQIRKFNLRTGDIISGPVRMPKEKEKYRSLLRVDSVFGKAPAEFRNRITFKKLTPIYPNRQMKLETDPKIMSTRIIDLLAPIGYGQRAMVVAPPKAGKTTLLKEIAHGITANDDKVRLIVVLVGERPEEVTDMERSVKGEVYASNFDEHPEHNCKVAEMALERAKRLVELGEDVVILMDSITRLARAYNITLPTSGKTLSGGFDPAALFPPKRFFGAARNFEEGGSLTIVATALVETGSRMDDLVFEEFKGTGNMELRLDRKLQQRRVFPAIDVNSSGTRNEELLLSKDVLNSGWRIRRMLEMLGKNEMPTEVLIDQMRKTKDNKEFLATLHEAV